MSSTRRGSALVGKGLKKIFSGEQQRPKFQLWGLAIFALIVGGFGLYILLSHAAPNPPTIYLSPETQTLRPGATISVQVREDSGATGINALQANFSYPSNLLTCSGISTASTAFAIEAQSSCSNGQVTIARGVTGGSAPLTGDQLVATVNFTVGNASGNAALAFTSGTMLASASTNLNILGSLAATGGASYTIDAAAPTVSISAPTSNSFVNGTSVTVSATAADTGGSALAGVRFQLDGVNIGAEDTASPYSIIWNTSTASNGTHTLRAIARDTVGNTTTSSGVALTVDNAAPTVSITAPASGSTARGTTTITATAADTGGSGVARVQFYVDGTLRSTDTTSPYSYAWDTTAVSDGSHTLTARSYDNAMTPNSTTSPAITVVVGNATNATDGQAPSAPGGFRVSATTSNSVSLSWTASTDNVRVTGYQIRRGGTLLTTTTGLTYTDSELASGTSYGYTVTAVDAASNASTAAGPVTGTTLASVIGDVDGSGHVNITDLSTLLTNFMTVYAPCDLNHDGKVDILDLSILLAHFGQ